ncbi:MAG: glycosyltransferase family 4 protein [Candidatus Theseobacter exili]|nr:glycosyltransferase family 4 protein [Candidatus Theseobacter exili]
MGNDMRLRVLHLGCPYLPYIGGSSMRLSQILEALVSVTEIESYVVTQQPTEDGRYSKDNELENVNGVLVHRVQNLLESLKATKRIVHRHKIDIIHAHGPRPAFQASLLCAGKTMVVEHHGLHDLSFVKRQLAKYAMRKAKAVILLSEASRKRAHDYFKIDIKRAFVIRNGIDLANFQIESTRETAKRDLFTVGYIGTFHEWQGVLTFIKSLPHVLKQSQQIHYLMVGQGPCFDEVRNYIHRYDLSSNVRLLGAVPQSQVKSYMQKMDVIVVPRPSTPATETIVPLKIFEAMAARRPIIISRVGGLLEILAEGENCLAFTPDDPEDLSNKIMILKNDPKIGLALAEKSYMLVQKQPDWKQVALSLADVYNSVSC